MEERGVMESKGGGTGLEEGEEEGKERGRGWSGATRVEGKGGGSGGHVRE